jgi:DNA polymerase-4
VLVRQADAVASRLRTRDLVARTISIKVRYGDFTTLTRSSTPGGSMATGPALVDAARRLLDQVEVTPGVRLFGISASSLGAAGPEQLTLDEAGRPSWDDAGRAVDDIRRRYGEDAIGTARLVGTDGRIRVARRGQQAWGPHAETADRAPAAGREGR